MELENWQRRVREFDAARGWDYFHPMEIFLNINEEIVEIWHRFRWVQDAEKQALAERHREAIEFDVGDLLCLVLKLANQFGVDAEHGLERVLREFAKQHPPLHDAAPAATTVSAHQDAIGSRADP